MSSFMGALGEGVGGSDGGSVEISDECQNRAGGSLT